ncbi:DNA cytosine methyltransferase [Acetobacter sacchari]|uniref:DNA (cytosine-5-)-methyltransferase n=1 Tax=Acetobacter sacchari TaxID=2661687 RepID=A0ABS3LUK3_9PROT|nr:DNA (cytosine-5-)-methyltransferase [Acetobacter sacchari]MBO1359586.1 DNA cytosine methyltransferase [Acetobacter sacchari]
MPCFYEFFAGGGMVRAGLGANWSCLFANDFDARKAVSYTTNWGDAGEFRLGDVAELVADDLPGMADLAWGSFPCQDLSLAGAGAGLGGVRSGTFYPFWGVISGLIAQGRAPGLVAVENVCGALTSHAGRDFQAICQMFAKNGYRFGAVVVDAALFLPQSRPRLFVIGIRKGMPTPAALLSDGPQAPFHTEGLRSAVAKLPDTLKTDWIWWRLLEPPRRRTGFSDLIEAEPASVRWHTAAETKALIRLMSPLHMGRLQDAKRSGRTVVGCVYRRTRNDSQGAKVQRAEVRFDDMAGCLRTPSGGSSRQTVLIVEGEHVRSRLISSREAARLMGLPDNYALPSVYNEAYHLLGDGVAAPVARHLAEHLFEPILAGVGGKGRQAA